MSLLRPRQRKNRRFDYEPRFYNPERERKLKERIRIKSRARRRRSPAGIIYFVILLSFAVYVYSQLG